MDQNTHNNESAPFVLPEIRPEDLPNPQEVAASTHEEESMAKAIEGGVLGASNNGPSGQSQSTFVDPSLFAAPPAAAAPTQSTTKHIKVVTDDLPAADNDLIEKAWVVKAKAIVEQTKDNPYEQTNEIKKIKADYQRKRFNSNLKVDPE